MLRELLEDLAAQGRIIFYCSHVLDVLEKVCARVLILRKGQVVAHGTIENLRQQMHQTSLEGIFAELTREQNYHSRGQPHPGGDAGVKRLEETHGIQFELMRHFLARMFDGEWSSAPGQWRSVAIGALALLLPAGVILLDTDYAHKYDALAAMPLPGPFRAGRLADELGILTLVFAVTGLLALFEWQSLFPSARDYMALAGYPIRSSQIFIARFGAVALFSSAFILAMNLLPSVIVPLVFHGRWQLDPSYVDNLAAHAVAAGLACYFIFLAILALQGVLLNILPGGSSRVPPPMSKAPASA